MSVWGLFFGWPGGQVWPNVLASGLTAGLAVGWSHRRLRKHIDRRHGQLAQHVTDTAAAGPTQEQS